MGSKTISLKDTTYDRLRREKGEDESFSDVIERLIGTDTGEHPLYELVGLADESELVDLRERARSFREDVDGRIGPNT